MVLLRKEISLIPSMVTKFDYLPKKSKYLLSNLLFMISGYAIEYNLERNELQKERIPMTYKSYLLCMSQ